MSSAHLRVRARWFWREAFLRLGLECRELETHRRKGKFLGPVELGGFRVEEWEYLRLGAEEVRGLGQ